jgi:iron complex outermembrane receptor protein
MTIFRKWLAVSASVLLAPVYAQAQSSSPAAPAPANAAGGTQLQEVIVTAERHETNLQRTPITVEVVGDATLQRQRILEFVDLNSVLTNTQIVPIGIATQVIIRGIGNNFVDPRADPSVATSINGLFYSRPLPIGFGFLDVSRVEVLEGPQGTLYGRNSAAGALNVITNQPVNKFEGLFQASGGNLGENDFTGVLNVPVGDRFAFRIAYDRDRRNGYISDYYDDIHSDTGRVSALWTPTEQLKVYLESNFVQVGGKGDATEPYPCAGSMPWTAYTPPACAALPPGGAFSFNSRNRSFVGSDEIHVDYNLDWGTLTSITGFVGTHERVAEQNGSYFTNYETADNYDYSEELRLSGHDTASHQGGFAWQIGTYLFTSTGNYLFHTQITGSNRPPTGTQAFNKIPQHSEAGYAQASYGLTDRLRLTAGIRYTSDYKRIDSSSSAYLPPTFTVPSPNVLGSASASNGKFTYKVGAEYDLAPRNLLYATVSTGLASAGVNGGSASAPLTALVAPAVFQPETITAYEVGSKNRFFDNRLQLNGAAYYYDFHNYQYLFPAYVQGGSVSGLQIQDAASVTAYGVEFSAEFAATRVDRFSGSLALTHATFGPLSYAAFAPPATAFAVNAPGGSELVNDPKWSALLGYEHTWRLNNGSSFTFGVNTKLSGRYLLVVNSTVPADYQNAYTMTDANIAYHWKNDRYELRGWVKNIENTPVNVYGEGATFNLYGIQPPRTYGGTITARF